MNLVGNPQMNGAVLEVSSLIAILSKAIKLHFIRWQVAYGKWQVTLAKVFCNLQLATCNQNAKYQLISFRSICWFTPCFSG
jgi:hypothetical protein